MPTMAPAGTRIRFRLALQAIWDPIGTPLLGPHWDPIIGTPLLGPHWDPIIGTPLGPHWDLGLHVLQPPSTYWPLPLCTACTDPEPAPLPWLPNAPTHLTA